MAFLSSLCLYIRSDLKYIDALFLGSGSATQSGLNTVDINLLNTWQQIVIYMVPLVTNPISINGFVVCLRLYWFEKRFQHIAKEQVKNRRSMAKSFSKAKTTERNIGEEERGVNGRNIVVMHETTRPNGMTNQDAMPRDFKDHIEKAIAEERIGSSQSSEGTGKSQGSRTLTEDRLDTTDDSRPHLKFADQVKRSNGLPDEPVRMPVQRSHEDHIAFLERQRNQDEGNVLRIPGPRDAEAGIAPISVDEEDPLSKVLSRRESGFSTRQFAQYEDTASEQLNDNDHDVQPARRNITIAEPVRSPVRKHDVEDDVTAKHGLGNLRFRRPKFLGGKEDEAPLPHARRTATFQTIRSALSGAKDDPMPYLSYQPTVGRNSAFVDLTEEQREELGGIEYRSLKTLGYILIAYFVGFSIFGVVCLTPWIYHNSSYGDVVRADGQGRAWWGIFTANSAFTDLGFTLTPDSMISFQRAQWPLVLMSFLIIIGNTGFPIMLRIIIWVTSRYVPKTSGVWEELKFLLDHPRRCFTLLFQSKDTWILFGILVLLNGLDLLFFIILDVSCFPS